MTRDKYNVFCAALPATTHVVQWGGADVWKVGGKVFAIAGWSKSEQPAYSFKVSEQNFHFLKDEPGYRHLVSLGLTKMKQKELGLNQNHT